MSVAHRFGAIVTAGLLWALVSAVTAQGGGVSNPAPPAETGTYVFLPKQSTLVQTGGIAGVHWTHAVAGQFQLVIDRDAKTASFTHVNANATDVNSPQRTLDLNDVFNLTLLTGTTVDGQTISFTGKAPDSSDVRITVTLQDGLARLAGQTTPPPEGRDFFSFSLDAVAQHKYSGGTGEPNDPYQIATAADLMTLGETPTDYDKHFILTTDIDLDPDLPDRKVFDKAVIAADTDSKERGFQGTPFTGVLDGNDQEIRNLGIKAPWSSNPRSNGEYVALIGQVDQTGQVKRLGLPNVSIDAQEHVGALAGNNQGTIHSCYSSGRVTGYGCVGGLVGQNDEGTIASSQSAGTVKGDSVGGLVGLNWGGTISSSYSSSTVVKSKHFGDIVGFDYAGGLVGQNGNGTISSSYSSGDVAGDILTGGLAGDNYGTIYSCYSSSNVIGGSHTGGLVGRNEGGIVSSYSTGNVSGTYSVGGLVGEDLYGGIVTSYSSGSVTGKKYVGGLIGESDHTSVYSSYWAIEASGWTESAGGDGKTTQQMRSLGTFTGWGRGAQWVIEDGKDYPHLTWEGRPGVPIADPPHYSGGIGDPNNPYQIRTPEDLASIGRFPADWDASFELVEDIDMASTDPNKALGIGTNGLPFAGTFDGHGHTVRNFNGDFMQGAFTGLFGWIGPSGTVRHLHLRDVVISNGCFVGGLAGYNEGTILACSTTGHIAAGDRAGGMVGENRGLVASSCASCDVSERGPAWVGGLVAANRGTVSSCYATGAVQGWCVGGLVADNRDGTITTSYSTGAVNLRGPVNNGGGLVSRIGFDDGRASRGRPAHPPDEGYGVVTASFWDAQTSGWSGAFGGIGLPTREMQKAATFLEAGWDFVGETANGAADVWWIDEGKDYPRLWWEVRH